jgi:iron(III) transport system ATP-binding protein
MSVELINVTKIFTDHDNKDREFTAVDSVNIKINDGEMVTFLGPSGCGKTTTLRIISGFETQTSGDVYIAGKLVNDLPANKRELPWSSSLTLFFRTFRSARTSVSAWNLRG